MNDLDLVKAAIEMQSRAYAPYSNYKVGAALLCCDGSVVTGCNVENASYGGTLCAERCAFVKAISKGKNSFAALALSASGERIVMPCGICLQFISEFVNDSFVLLCSDNSGCYKRFTISQLLPYGFNKRFLK